MNTPPAGDLARALTTAQTCLATAGGILIQQRGQAPNEAQQLITAMRDTITDLLRDIDTIRQLTKNS